MYRKVVFAKMYYLSCKISNIILTLSYSQFQYLFSQIFCKCVAVFTYYHITCDSELKICSVKYAIIYKTCKTMTACHKEEYFWEQNNAACLSVMLFTVIITILIYKIKTYFLPSFLERVSIQKHCPNCSEITLLNFLTLSGKSCLP